MLRRLFTAVQNFALEAFKPIENAPLPELVTQQLVDKGYRKDISAICYHTCAVSFAHLISPSGEYVNHPSTPPDVQRQFEEDARAAYEACGLPAPERIPGSEDACSSYKAPVWRDPIP